jgi:uncharacterized protein YxjI
MATALHAPRSLVWRFLASKPLELRPKIECAPSTEQCTLSEAAMQTYEVTQALLSVGTVYHVRKPREEDVLYTVRGHLMSPTPKFHLLEGDDGKEVGLLTGNFIKTKYEISADGKQLGALVFPAVAFKKTLTLAVDEEEYEADGGVFRGIFQCKGKDGSVVLEIAKELSIRDTFTVKANEKLPFQVGLLSAVAIHSRFYEMV